MTKPVVKIPHHRKLKLLVLAVFQPSQFVAEEIKHNAEMNYLLLKRGPVQSASNIGVLRTALLTSFVTCGVATIGGGFFGIVAAFLFGSHAVLATVAIITGTAILLWATLAVQGWSIQSVKGETLTEPASQWIFRSLYAVGTGLISLGSMLAVM